MLFDEHMSNIFLVLLLIIISDKRTDLKNFTFDEDGIFNLTDEFNSTVNIRRIRKNVIKKEFIINALIQKPEVM